MLLSQIYLLLNATRVQYFLCQKFSTMKESCSVFHDQLWSFLWNLVNKYFVNNLTIYSPLILSTLSPPGCTYVNVKPPSLPPSTGNVGLWTYGEFDPPFVLNTNSFHFHTFVSGLLILYIVLSWKIWTPYFGSPQSKYIEIFGPPRTKILEIYGSPLKYFIPLQNVLLTPFLHIQRGVQIFHLK